MTIKQANTGKLEQVVSQAPAPQAQIQDWKHAVTKYHDQFLKLVGSPSDVQRFQRMIFTHVGKNQKLVAVAKANPIALITACLDILEKNLDPSVSNEVYLIPYGNQIVAQVGYKGLQKLTMRAAKNLGFAYTKLSAEEVRENDRFTVRLGSNSAIIHDLPEFGTDRGQIKGYYAIAKTSDGREEYLVMTLPELDMHFARFCKAKSNPASPWSDKANYPAWCLKTVLRLLISRKLPQDSRLSEAMQTDYEVEAEAHEIPKSSMEEIPEIPESTDGGGRLQISEQEGGAPMDGAEATGKSRGDNKPPKTGENIPIG